MINKLEANGREYNLSSVKQDTFAAQHKKGGRRSAIKMLCGDLVSALSALVSKCGGSSVVITVQVTKRQSLICRT